MRDWAFVSSNDNLLDVIKKINQIGFLELSLRSDDEHKSETTKMLKTLIDNSELIKQNIKTISINLLNERLPKGIFFDLFKLSQKIKDAVQCEICVDHMAKDGICEDKKVSWDIDTILKANLAIEEVCEFIKANDFSPMEALAYIHRYVSTVARYHKTETSYFPNSNKDQFFAGAFLKTPEIVCMGYSSLMQEIIKTLNMPGLKCELVYVDMDLLNEGTTGRHARCFVKVKDDKYGIDQTMFDDPTWDNVKNGDTMHSKYANFALSNDCHCSKKNIAYAFEEPKYVKLKHNNSYRDMSEDEVCDNATYNSRNQIDQTMIEAIHFNILQKECPNKSVDEIYGILSKMANISFEEQIKRGYDGCLKQKDITLTKGQASKLFEQNKKFNYNQVEATL